MWFDILKVMPPSKYDAYAMPEHDMSHVDNPAQVFDYGTTRVIVRGHYLMRVKERTSNRNTDEIEKWVNCVKDKAQGKYWFYRTSDENNYEIILVDIYTTKEANIAGTKKKFNRNMRNPETKELITKIIVFTNYFGGRVLLTQSQLSKDYRGRKRIDCFYQGVKPKHPKGQAMLEKEPKKEEPKEKPKPTEKPRGFTLQPPPPRRKNKNRQKNRRRR